VFVRIYDDINGLIHLSELTDEKGSTPNDVVKIGQLVKAKIILLDIPHRKIGLSIKALQDTTKKEEKAE
jgi:small subunit ribosomal protein S1